MATENGNRSCCELAQIAAVAGENASSGGAGLVFAFDGRPLGQGLGVLFGLALVGGIDGEAGRDIENQKSLVLKINAQAVIPTVGDMDSKESLLVSRIEVSVLALSNGMVIAMLRTPPWQLAAMEGRNPHLSTT